MKKKFKPLVEISVSLNGISWLVINPDNMFDELCITEIDLTTLDYNYMRITQALKEPKKERKH